jgi:diacylglycerol kinase family enzyme
MVESGRVLVLLNARAGTLAASQSGSEPVSAEFARLGIEAEVVAVPHPEALERARAAASQGFRAVVAGGGDGTVGSIAGVLVGGSLPLGVLPLGTRNHFARDLGLDLPLPEAVSVVGAGHWRAIDVGTVNDHAFVNNSSLGLYPQMVREREEGGRRFGLARTLATLLATLHVVRRFRLTRVRLEQGGQTVVRTTPFVFVGNNEYSMHLFALGERARLDAGTLSLYTARTRNRWGLLGLALAALFDRLDQHDDFERSDVPEAWIETARRVVRVAVDGELLMLATPLHYRCLAGALRVLVPAPAQP